MKVVFRVAQIGGKPHHSGVDPANVRREGKARALFSSLRPGQRLLARVEISLRRVHRRLCHDLLFEQFRLTIIGLLRERDLRLCLFDSGRRLIERCLELLDALLRLRKRRLLLIDDKLIGPWVDAKELVTLLERPVGLDSNLRHPAFDLR